MDISWIKITTDVFDDEKILLIEQLPEHDSIIVIWFKLLALAGKSNNNGIFMLSNKIPYTAEMFAAIFRRSLNTVKLALSTFEQYGMIEIIDNVVTLPNWEKYQNIKTLDDIREQTRKRVQKHRENQKHQIEHNKEETSENFDTCNATCNDCNATVTDKIREEEDKNKNINSKSSAKAESSSDLTKLKNCWNDCYIKLFNKKPDDEIPKEKHNSFWGGVVKQIKNKLTKYDVDTLDAAIRYAAMEQWVVDGGFIINTVLSDSVVLKSMSNTPHSPLKQNNKQNTFHYDAYHTGNEEETARKILEQQDKHEEIDVSDVPF